MSIDAIIEKIVNDANEYADVLISDALAEGNKIVSEAVREAEEIAEQSVVRCAKDTSAIINKMVSAAELEARKMRLAAKQKEFSAAMDAAIDQIANMDNKSYIAFFARRIAETGIEKGELKLNTKDRKAIGAKLTKAANGLIKGGELKLSGDTIEAKGGFVITAGDMEVDHTLEAMAVTMRDRIAAKIVAVLFQT